LRATNAGSRVGTAGWPACWLAAALARWRTASGLRTGMPRPWRAKALRSDGQVVPQLGRGGIHAAELFGQGEGALGVLGAVGEEPAGLPAQRVAIVPAPYSVEQYTIMAWKRVRAGAGDNLCPEGAPQHDGAWGRVAWCPHPSTSTRGRPVGQLGANAHSRVLEAGRVPDCCLGLRLDSAVRGRHRPGRPLTVVRVANSGPRSGPTRSPPCSSPSAAWAATAPARPAAPAWACRSSARWPPPTVARPEARALPGGGLEGTVGLPAG
jgi:hypothetical protein